MGDVKQVRINCSLPTSNRDNFKIFAQYPLWLESDVKLTISNKIPAYRQSYYRPLSAMQRDIPH